MTTVSHRADHARTSTTTDIYAYLLTSSDEHAANVLDEATLEFKVEGGM